MITTHHDELDGLPAVWRSAPGGDPPVLYLHGVPDAGDLWAPFLERTGGVAPDLPGFGGSAKRGDLDYSIAGYADWLERFTAHAGLDRVRLVMHDWGAVGLALAQRAPERIERLVAIDAVPFLPGYRWHPLARVWRAPLLGEAAMGMVDQADREAAPARRPRRSGAGRASTPAPSGRSCCSTARARPRCSRTRAATSARSPRPRSSSTAPATATSPPASPTGWPRASATAARSTSPGAGHWPWLDRPELVDRICAFLADD